jgi:quinol monooxygenase YgiN
MLVIAVRLDINPDARDAFRRHVLEAAAMALEKEAGCKAFRVSFADDDAVCFLYEVYADRAAFEAHGQTEHYKAFAEKSHGMVADKRVEQYELPTGAAA